jgi:prolipoprotein diacylglyceryltransferase
VETEVPWAIALWDAPRQPVQLYELAGSLLILGLLLRAGQDIPAPGLGFLLFAALYGGLRVLLEPLRAGSHLLPGGLRSVQVVALLAVMWALWQMRTWVRASGAVESAE